MLSRGFQQVGKDFPVFLHPNTHGTLVDPHGGETDLHAGVLCYVSDLFNEAPVLILLLALCTLHGEVDNALENHIGR